MQKVYRLVILALGCLLAACTSMDSQVTKLSESETGSLPIALPATFAGQTACVDCERVEVVLNLRADKLYQLRKRFVRGAGSDEVESQMGRYRYSAEDRVLVLGKQKGALKSYVLQDDNRLTFLEWQGTDRQTQYELVRSLEVDPFVDLVKLRGMFAVQNDRGYFRECAGGNRFGVDERGDYKKALQDYFNTPHLQNEQVLMSILGSLEKIPSVGSATGEDVIVIDQFRRFYPNQDCDGSRMGQSLTGAYWRLVEIDGGEAGPNVDNITPYLQFKSDRNVQGFGGCNKITGTYLIKGDVFLVQRDPLTRTACPEGMETENRFLEAIDSAETYRIEDNSLEFIDRDEHVRARFQAGR